MSTNTTPQVGGQPDPFQEFADNRDNLEQQVELLLDQRDKVVELEDQLDNAKKARAIAEQALIEKMIEQGVEHVRALGHAITRTEQIHANVPAADRAQQIDWLRQIGAGGLVQETVNAASFGALVRNDFVKAGKEAEVPPFVRIYKQAALLVRTTAKGSA